MDAFDSNQGFRRRFPRRFLMRPVGCLENGGYVMGNGVEIGEGGMKLESSQTMVMGQIVVVNFFIPQKDFVTATAEIVYTAENTPPSQLRTYGMKFVKLSFESKRLIRDFIAAKTALEAKQASRVSA